MSGQPPNLSNSESSSDDDAVVANVRQLSGVEAGAGPDDAHVLSAVRGFVERFDYWYIRVMRGAVKDYRTLVIKRINPFIRRIECDGMSAYETASKLVDDYNSRNFVTAGGWALEAMAVRISSNARKSTAKGIDIEKGDPSTADYHLYVLKSGLVTRNSDILSSLKKHARHAEKLFRQDGSKHQFSMHYAILAGKTESSFEDGINRPSSGEFWSHMTGLSPKQAVALVLAIAAEAGKLVRRDASEHVAAMKLLVSDYIAKRDSLATVDWEFIALRNMASPTDWSEEDKARHSRALSVLAATGYEISAAPKPKRKNVI